jgi:hypothetical protein
MGACSAKIQIPVTVEKYGGHQGEQSSNVHSE